MTKEHVIPEQIGGKLTANFLCERCNSRLGSDVEAAVRADASIRIAIEELVDTIPALAKDMRDGLEFIGHGPLGQIRGTIKEGHFRMAAARGPGGSVVQDVRQGRKNVQHQLKKRGIDEAVLAQAMTLFDSAPLDLPVALPGGLAIIQREGRGLAPALDGPQLDVRVLLKMAYELLAIHIGESIYDKVTALDQLRVAIWEGNPRPEFYEIEYLTSRKYTPIHGLAIVGLPHVVVTVCLFDWLRYRVHLKKVAVNPPNLVYSHCLDTGEEVWTQLTVESRREEGG